MRFRFCGNLDAPDWLLAEIAVLAPLSSATCDTLCGVVIQQLKTSQLNYPAVETLIKNNDLKSSDVKGIVAALNYILRNSCKYGVARNDLETEVQQMGLTKDSASKVSEHYETSKETLITMLREKSLSLGKPSGEIEWRVDSILGSSAGKPRSGLCVQMRVDDGAGTTSAFEVDSDLFQLLHEELTNASKQMKQLGGSN